MSKAPNKSSRWNINIRFIHINKYSIANSYVYLTKISSVFKTLFVLHMLICGYCLSTICLFFLKCLHIFIFFLLINDAKKPLSLLLKLEWELEIKTDREKVRWKIKETYKRVDIQKEREREREIGKVACKRLADELCFFFICLLLKNRFCFNFF